MALNTSGKPVPQMLPASDADLTLLHAIEGGLPLVPRPYAAVGERIGMSEGEVIDRLGRLLQQGVIKRLGVVVRHRKLGYRANGMVVWDLPDARIDELGHCIGSFDFVTLCYQRPRRLPDWRYNLFSMIHGQDPQQVRSRVEQVIERCALSGVQYEVLFSGQCFKQRGARYAPAARLPLPDLPADARACLR